MFAAARTGGDARDPRGPQPVPAAPPAGAGAAREGEGITIFPGVPFNFRLMAEAPAHGRPLARAALLLRGHRAPAAVLRRLPRQVRGARPPALRLHRGGHAHRQPRRGPGGVLRVGRPAGGRRAGADRGRRGRRRRPWATIGEVAVKSPGLTNGYADMAELNEPGLPRRLLRHRRPRAPRRGGPAHHHGPQEAADRGGRLQGRPDRGGGRGGRPTPRSARPWWWACRARWPARSSSRPWWCPATRWRSAS